MSREHTGTITIKTLADGTRAFHLRFIVNYIERLAATVRRAIPPELVPDEADVDDLCRIYALLILTKGEQMTPEDVHDAWATWMTMQDPDHESLKPFHDLDVETRREDAPFLRALQAVARDLQDAAR
jgi:hypothetical protein